MKLAITLLLIFFTACGADDTSTADSAATDTVKASSDAAAGSGDSGAAVSDVASNDSGSASATDGGATSTDSGGTSATDSGGASATDSGVSATDGGGASATDSGVSATDGGASATDSGATGTPDSAGPPIIIGSTPSSCGAPGQGLTPVDCTKHGDSKAMCVFSNHCFCSKGFKCESKMATMKVEECKPGSSCVPAK